MKPIFEEEKEKVQNKKILSYLNKLKGLSYPEKEQLKLIVLWESIESYDPTRGCLFTTHLYSKCRYKFLDFLRKKTIPVGEFINKSYITHENLLDELPLLDKMVLEDRFVNKLTINEMIKKYKMNRSSINSLIEKSIEVFKEYLNE